MTEPMHWLDEASDADVGTARSDIDSQRRREQRWFGGGRQSQRGLARRCEGLRRRARRLRRRRGRERARGARQASASGFERDDTNACCGDAIRRSNVSSDEPKRYDICRRERAGKASRAFARRD
jgi:hypothetical protein